MHILYSITIQMSPVRNKFNKLHNPCIIGSLSFLYRCIQHLLYYMLWRNGCRKWILSWISHQCFKCFDKHVLTCSSTKPWLPQRNFNCFLWSQWVLPKSIIYYIGSFPSSWIHLVCNTIILFWLTLSLSFGSLSLILLLICSSTYSWGLCTYERSLH